MNFLSGVPKLTGRDNYDEWSFAVENFLILEGLDKCLSGAEPDTTLQNKARAKLVLTIDPSLYVHVRDSQDAKALWLTLRTMYADTGFTRKIYLLRALISLRLDNCDNMESYVTQVVETAQRLKKTGFSIDEKWIGSLLLAGLPDKFSPMIMAIEHSGIEITTENIKTKLLDMSQEGAQKPSGSAFVVGKPSYSKKKDQQRKDSSKLQKVKCYRCKKFGHYMNKCPKASSEVSDDSSRSGDNRRGVSALSAVFSSGNFSSSDWYIDSGASHHVTCKKEWISDFKEMVEPRDITIANQTKLPVLGTGNIKLTTIVNGQKHYVEVRNALYVPGVTTNLLSIGQIIKKGNKVNFNDKNCTVINCSGVVIAIAQFTDNVYKLITCLSQGIEVSQVMKSADAVVNLAISKEVWHRRLAHLNYQDLTAMKNHCSVEGLQTMKADVCANKICVTCCEGKQTRLPFRHVGQRAKSHLEVVHTDLCGPMEKVSLGGSRYFLILEDDFSRYTHVYFLKTKDEALEYFKEFKQLVETQTGQKIKCLRSDNGGEFCGNDFEQYLKRAGIVHQRTNPHTPEQNGMSERMNRTVIEKARCLLFEADMSKIFWAEAINTAIYLRNRCIARGLELKTPYELWYGRKPDISNIRIFGSETMVHIPKPKRLKWDKKSRKMILVGFGDDTKGYRLYDPIDKKVIFSRDVIINEKENLEVIISHDSSENKELEEQESPESVGESESLDESFVSLKSDGEDEEPMIPRRSERVRIPNTRLDDYVTYMCQSDINLEDVPLSVKEVLSRPDKEKWRKAMLDEMQSFDENDTWDLVDMPSHGTIVDSKWVFKIKMCDSNSDPVYRARLVAKGFTQKQGLDYDETFSPVVRHSTIRMLFGLSVKLGLKVYHLDVKTAFLNGYLEEDVYMRQPEGFVLKSTENKVCKLKKAVYGLKQSSRAWNKRVDEVLLEIDYSKSKYEPCLYIKKCHESITVVALYVDDFFIFGNNMPEIEFLKGHLCSYFKIKDLGEAKQILGVRISQEKGQIKLDQEGYIDQILKRFDMSNSNSVATPMEVNLGLEAGDLKSDGTNNVNIPYQRLIGSLMYIAVLTRPDIAYSVSFLSQFNSCYTEAHWKSAKRLLRYLQGTKSKCLTFTENGCCLEGYSDSDWGSNKLDRKSYTGFVFKLAGGAISWKSFKQKSTALSTTEAEYMAMSEAAKEAIYLKNLYEELNEELDALILYVDNQSAQKLAANPILHSRSKHIDVRYHFVRETVANNVISLKYLASTDMTADILTKSLPTVKHKKFVSQLGLV